jgi:hypothetical protein
MGSPTAPARSLFAHFTAFGHSYAATDNIKFLLNAVAHDACSAQHNSWAFFKLLEAVRATCDQIDDRISKVDASNDVTDAEIWTHFYTYTKAIDPLERLVSYTILVLISMGSISVL